MPQSDTDHLQATVPALPGTRLSENQLWTVSAVTLGAALPGILLFRPGTMYALLLIGSVAGLLAVNWYPARTQIREVLRSPVTWLAAAMLLAFFISAMLGINPANSLAKLSQLAGAGVASVMMTIVLRQMPIEQLNLLAKVLVFATLAMMTLALIDILIGSQNFSIAYQGRAGRTFGYEGRLHFFSSVLAVLLPLTIAAAAMPSVSNARQQMLILTVIGVGVITVLACGGRSGWAGTAAALVTLLAGHFLLDRLRPSLWHVAFATLVVALGIGLYWCSYGTAVFQQRMNMVDLHAGSVGDRLVLWKVGIAHLSDNPLFGIGLTNYKDLPEAQYRHPHNWALQLALETGAIGFSLFCAFVVSMLWANTKPGRTNRFGLASFAATIGFLVAGLANTSLVNMWWLTFFILGGLLGHGLSRRTDTPYSTAISLTAGPTGASRIEDCQPTK